MTRRPPPPVGDDNPVTPPARPIPNPPPRRPDPEHGETLPPDEHAARSISEYYGGKPAPLPDGAAPAPDREVVETLSEAGPDPDAIIAGLIRLRTKQVDPMTDWVGDGTRMLRWIQAAIAHEADLTPRTRQEIVRDALLGIRPLSEDLLDLHYKAQYGKDRHG